MSFRTTTILFGLVVVLLVGLIIIFSGQDTGSAEGLVPAFTAAGYKPEDVEIVELVRTEPNEQKLVFTRRDKVWTLTEPYAARIESGRVNGIVEALFRAKLVPYAGLSSNLSVHGLAQPTYKVTLRGKNNTSATVNLGLTTAGGSNAYTFVTTDRRPDKPVAVRAGDLSALFRGEPGTPSRDGPAARHALWLAEFRKPRLIASELNALEIETQSLKLTHAGKELVLTNSKEGLWSITSPAGLGPADTLGDSAARPDTVTGVRPLLNILATLQANTAQDYLEGVSPADLAKYGLADDDASAVRVELTPKVGPRETVMIGGPVLENGKPVVPAKYYCRVEGDAGVAKVPIGRLAALQKIVADPSDLRSRDLFADSRKHSIDALDIQLGSEIAKLRRLKTAATPQWVVYGGAKPYAARQEAVERFITELTRSRVARDIVPGSLDDAFKAPQGEIRVWTDSLGQAALAADGSFPAEPPTTGTATSFLLGTQDTVKVPPSDNLERIAHVRRGGDGAPTVFRIPAATHDILTRPRSAYIDAKIPSFTTSVAKKLRFNRGAELWELVKSDEMDPSYPRGKWLFAQPAAWKDRIADADKIQSLLVMLAGTTAPVIVNEAPTPEQRSAAGVQTSAARMQVTVTLDTMKDSERTYYFGTELENKLDCHFGVPDSPFLMAIGKSILDQFQTMELRDPTLFRLEESKLVLLELTGWKGPMDAAPRKLKLTRDKTGWAASEPVGFTVEVPKLEGLLKALSAPRASQYVIPPPPAAEHGLELADGALEIIALQNNNKSYVLRLGKLDSTRQMLFAISSADKDVVLKLPAGPFQPYLAGPDSLGAAAKKP